MKNTKQHLRLATLSVAAVFSVVIAWPAASYAGSLDETSAAANIGVSADSGQSGPVSQTLRNALKARVQAEADLRTKNLENNEDYRNAILEKRPNLASTTREKPEARRSSTSTDREDDRDDRRETFLEAFKARQTSFIKQLQLSLDNLAQIRARISARIDAEAANGRDLSAAKSLLVIADQKISLAKSAVQEVASYVPTASSTLTVQARVTASTTIDLLRPRQIGSEAIKAVNEARKALQQVVVAIAHSMGLKVGQDGRVTATSTVSASSTSSQ